MKAVELGMHRLHLLRGEQRGLPQLQSLQIHARQGLHFNRHPQCGL